MCHQWICEAMLPRPGALRPASSLWRAARRSPTDVTGSSNGGTGHKSVFGVLILLSYGSAGQKRRLECLSVHPSREQQKPFALCRGTQPVVEADKFPAHRIVVNSGQGGAKLHRIRGTKCMNCKKTFRPSFYRLNEVNRMNGHPKLFDTYDGLLKLIRCKEGFAGEPTKRRTYLHITQRPGQDVSVLAVQGSNLRCPNLIDVQRHER